MPGSRRSPFLGRASGTYFAPLLAFILLFGLAEQGGADGNGTDAARLTALLVMRVMVSGKGVRPFGETLGKNGTGLIFTGVACPIANGYAPDIAALSRRVAKRGGTVLLVFSNPDDIPEARAHCVRYGLAAVTIILDEDQRLADALRAKFTPEAFVLDAQGRTRYQGRLDDRYIERGKPTGTAARAKDLNKALDAVLRNRPVARPRVPAFGCLIERRRKFRADSPTYAADVAPILKNHCVVCHHAGAIGPITLTTYAEARRFAANIASVTERRFMPPWKPVLGCGDLQGERSLTDAEKKTLRDWAEGGTAAGDVTLAPAPPKPQNGWALGKPDLILTLPERYAIPAGGADSHRCFVIPTGLTADAQVVALEYQPGNRRVVRHIEGWLDTTGTARQMNSKAPGRGYMSFGGPGFLPVGELGEWSPGSAEQTLPDGMARFLPKGADVVLQVTYHPTGKAETDQTRIGLYFARTPAAKRLRFLPLEPKHLMIPAGEKNYAVTREITVPFDMRVLFIRPHMHLLGKTLEVTADLPDGTKRPLIRIEDWDYGWQSGYAFREPILLRRGTRLTLRAVFDNSAANPLQPSRPPKRVMWGRHLADEMCSVAFSYAAEDENDPLIRMMDGVSSPPRQ